MVIVGMAYAHVHVFWSYGICGVFGYFRRVSSPFYWVSPLCILGNIVFYPPAL